MQLKAAMHLKAKLFQRLPESLSILQPAQLAMAMKIIDQLDHRGQQSHERSSRGGQVRPKYSTEARRTELVAPKGCNTKSPAARLSVLTRSVAEAFGAMNWGSPERATASTAAGAVVVDRD